MFTRIALILLLWLVGCSDEPCECWIGESCVEGTCQPTSCFGGCPTGQVCVDSVCGVPEDQCVAPGQPCDPSLPVADDRSCIDLDGFGSQPPTCVEHCRADGSCSSGALCFWVSTAVDASCASDADCGAGLSCVEAGCRETICRPSECAGTVAGLQTCQDLYGGTSGFEDGAVCVEFQNSANYCFPAGTKALRQACVSLEVATTNGAFTDTCAAGLVCVDGTCRTPCSDDTSCANGERCLLADQNATGLALGFCETTCDAFEVGSCGPGKTCLPITQTEGVCTDAGDVPAFEACDPTLRNCVDGTVCATYQDGNANLGIPEISRCQPMCNVAIAAAESDGSVSELAQAARDTTCPNPPVQPAAVVITNLSTRVSAVDVYLDDRRVAAGVMAGQRSDLIEVPAGQVTFRVLEAGAPSTDAALAEEPIALRASRVSEQVVYDEPLVPDSALILNRPASGASTSLEVVNLGDAADVIAVPTGDDLGDPSTQVELLTQSVAGADLPDGAYDIIAFVSGGPRNDRFLAVAELNNVQISGDQVVYLSGTVDDADDLVPNLALFGRLEDSSSASGVPTFTCVPLGEQAYGACRQKCMDGSGFGSQCQGTAMGCGPDFIAGPDDWGTYCAPMGDAVRGEPCTPRATYGVCAEGLYCDEIGNTAPGFDPVQRGRCESLCVLGDPDNPYLSCGLTRECRAIDYGGFDIGECATPCEPTRFADPSCPAGQDACLPVASLRPGADGMTLVTSEEPTFCSVAGNIPVGQPCSSSDCVASSECLFPRSPQSSFVTSLLSQYVGGIGLQSVCTPRCNPFDPGPDDVACPSGQTCLFNFPYNADVGSCAPIAENAQLNGPCTKPGESCGQDAICVADGGTNICYRFCQFTGTAPDGAFQRSTCPSPLTCNPLVNDLGVCSPL